MNLFAVFVTISLVVASTVKLPFHAISIALWSQIGKTFSDDTLKGRKVGSPLDHLPKNIEVLTGFGERADFSPDNKRIAFMTKSFGDAMVLDLATRQIKCLTCNIPAAVFLRVMHLSNGDYILIGPEKFEDIRISRSRDNELWYLSKVPGSKPIKLGVHMSEGMAISKKKYENRLFTSA